MKTEAGDVTVLQVVFVKWGVKYSSAYVNSLVDQILEHSDAAMRFVCFTDDPEGLRPEITAKPFPDMGVPLQALISRNGSLPKLGMFKPGELEAGVETIYIDLDTAIFGDIDKVADCLRQHRGLFMCSRHAIPHWRVRGLVQKLDPKRYYLGNTAVMAFYVEDWYGIYERFLEDYPVYMEDPSRLSPEVRKLYAGGNERIISHAAAKVSRVFPRSLVTKFTQEYMAPWLWLADLKDRLPHVRARRAGQVIVTFHGEPLKPVHLMEARHGDVLQHKFHRTRWSYDRIGNYWREQLAAGQDDSTN